MVKKIAEKFNRLSRVHQRHRQQTDRQQTTDRRLIAYSKRNVVRSLKTLWVSTMCAQILWFSMVRVRLRVTVRVRVSLV